MCRLLLPDGFSGSGCFYLLLELANLSLVVGVFLTQQLVFFFLLGMDYYGVFAELGEGKYSLKSHG